MKSTSGAAISSSSLTKSTGKTGSSSAISTGVKSNATIFSDVKGKAIVYDDAGELMSFKDVKLGPHEGEVRFRLIHFWEARNAQTKVLIGVEMLLIDDKETVIQGFIPHGRFETYLPRLKAGATYRLSKFFGSKNKILYRVA